MITHDLGVVAELSDDILVMYAGRVAEYGSAADIFARPGHPYTWGLLASMPRMDRERLTRLVPIPGTPPSLIRVPPGCPFHPRCRYAHLTGGRSETEVPELRAAEDPGHLVACHLTAAREGRAVGLAVGRARFRRMPGSQRRKTGDAETGITRRGGSVSEQTQTPQASAGIGGQRADRRRAAPGYRPGPAFPGDPGRDISGRRSARYRPLTGSTCPCQGPDPRPGRRIGQREDHHRPPAHAAGRADQRPDRDRRPRRHAPAAGPDAPATARDPDDLPGSLLLAQPPAHGRRDRGRAVPVAEGQAAGRGQACRAGTARAGRSQPRALQPVPVRVLRRPAAAHRDRPHARAAAQADHRRRAGLRAGRVDPGAGHQPARGPAGRAGPDLCGDRARPVRGPAHQRPGGGHVPRQDRRDGQPGPAVRQAAASVHGCAALRGSGARTTHQHRGQAGTAQAHQARGRRAEPAQPAAGLPLPHQVLEGAADLQDAGAAARRACPRAPGRLPLPGEHLAGQRGRAGRPGSPGG